MLKKIFITGLAASVPIIITLYVVIGLFTFADSILGNFINNYMFKYFGYKIPGLGLIISLFIIFLLGFFVHISSLRLHRWVERMFFKFPLVNKIYVPIKKIVDFLFFPPQKSFRAVVVVEYPRQGLYSLGFVTTKSSYFSDQEGTYFYVFIPSTPSPLTGFTIIVKEKDLRFLNIGIEEAIKIIVSGGLLYSSEK